MYEAGFAPIKQNCWNGSSCSANSVKSRVAMIVHASLHQRIAVSHTSTVSRSIPITSHMMILLLKLYSWLVCQELARIPGLSNTSVDGLSSHWMRYANVCRFLQKRIRG